MTLPLHVQTALPVATAHPMALALPVQMALMALPVQMVSTALPMHAPRADSYTHADGVDGAPSCYCASPPRGSSIDGNLAPHGNLVNAHFTQ